MPFCGCFSNSRPSPRTETQQACAFQCVLDWLGGFSAQAAPQHGGPSPGLGLGSLGLLGLGGGIFVFRARRWPEPERTPLRAGHRAVEERTCVSPQVPPAAIALQASLASSGDAVVCNAPLTSVRHLLGGMTSHDGADHSQRLVCQGKSHHGGFHVYRRPAAIDLSGQIMAACTPTGLSTPGSTCEAETRRLLRHLVPPSRSRKTSCDPDSSCGKALWQC